MVTEEKKRQKFCPLYVTFCVLSPLKGNNIVPPTVCEEVQEPWTTVGSATLLQRAVQTGAVTARMEGRPIPAQQELFFKSSRNPGEELIMQEEDTSFCVSAHRRLTDPVLSLTQPIK